MRLVLEWVVIALLLTYGRSDSLREVRHPDLSLAEQQDMADQLDAALEPGQTVLNMGSLWFVDLSGRDNPTRLNWAGPKILTALESQGLTVVGEIQDIQTHGPVVVIIDRSYLESLEELSDWLYEGEFWEMGLLFSQAGPPPEQAVFVRKGNDELRAIISTWPLEYSQAQLDGSH